MSKNVRLRPVRLDQFTEQLEEIGVSDLLPVELGENQPPVKLRLGVTYNRDDHADFMRRLKDAAGAREAALVMLDYNPDEDAEDALARVEAAGYTPDQLGFLFAAETSALQERLGNVRPRR